MPWVLLTGVKSSPYSLFPPYGENFTSANILLFGIPYMVTYQKNPNSEMIATLICPDIENNNHSNVNNTHLYSTST